MNKIKLTKNLTLTQESLMFYLSNQFQYCQVFVAGVVIQYSIHNFSVFYKDIDLKKPRTWKKINPLMRPRKKCWQFSIWEWMEIRLQNAKNGWEVLALRYYIPKLIDLKKKKKKKGQTHLVGMSSWYNG